jgi:MFS transporter, MHS family, proline/betaine transporter
LRQALAGKAVPRLERERERMSTDDPRSKVTPAVARRVAGAAAIGNFMEWFDFAVYGFFAVTIGKVFFPSDSDTASLLSSLAVYGVAFLVRPVGGLVLGAFADHHGRRAARPPSSSSTHRATAARSGAASSR